MTTSLGAILASRRGGYWEFLATAAGNEAAVGETLRRISPAVLRQAELDGAPFDVEMRVEAIAVWKPELLEVVCREWPVPAHLSCDPFQTESDFFGSAWCAALRFVSHLFTREELASRILYLQEAVERLLEPPAAIGSWEQLISGLEAGALETADLRALDRVGADFGPLSHTDLLRLLGDAKIGMGRLRVLRGRSKCLNHVSRRYLRALLLELWPHNLVLNVGSNVSIPLLEVVLEFEPDVVCELTESYVAALDACSSQGELSCLVGHAFPLLGSGWLSR